MVELRVKKISNEDVWRLSIPSDLESMNDFPKVEKGKNSVDFSHIGDLIQTVSSYAIAKGTSYVIAFDEGVSEVVKTRITNRLKPHLDGSQADLYRE
jgi:hypothetical protein